MSNRVKGEEALSTCQNAGLTLAPMLRKTVPESMGYYEHYFKTLGNLEHISLSKDK